MIRTFTTLGLSAIGLTLPAAAIAQSEDTVRADVSATMGYSNNPFSIASTSGTGAALATIDVAPAFVHRTAQSTITVSADANFQQYLRRYGHNDSYSGALDYRGRPSQRLTTHARIDLSSAVLGSFNNYLPLATSTSATSIGTTTTTIPSGSDLGSTSSAGSLPAVIPITQYTDIGLYGARYRRRTGRASGDLGITLSARDALTVSGYGEVTRYNGFAAGDYQAYGGSLGYQRRLSGTLSLGLAGSASSYNYRTGFGDSRVYSIQATGSAQLSERWSADGALGASFVSSDTAGSTRNTSLSGNLNLCRRGPQSTMCAQLLRQVSPTGLVGSQYVTSGGLNWSKRLDERQDVSLGASYSKIGGVNQPIAGVLPYQSEYVQTYASYSRRLAQRLRLVASVNYRDILDSAVKRASDFGGQIGLTYRFGDPR